MRGILNQSMSNDKVISPAATAQLRAYHYFESDFSDDGELPEAFSAS
jgi:hypothetical protein